MVFNSNERRHLILLWVLAVLYLFVYFGHPALPGNNPAFPLGWWGWFDQGEYLKAAKAISRFDLESSNFFYPPLYPLLGAIFVVVNPMHAFAILNMACFLLFAHYFVSMAARHTGWWWAALILLLTFVSPNNIILYVWAEPWTSSLVSAIFAFLLFDVDKYTSGELEISKTRLIFWGVLGGAVFLARPVDAVVITPLFLYVVWHIWRGPAASHKYSHSKALRFHKIGTLLVSGLSVVTLFFLFNFFVHGSFGGRYFAMAETNGFHLADVFEKLVSLFLDSGAIYNVPKDAIFAQLKWLALVVPAAIYGLIKGGPTVRIVITCILVQVLIYAPYADLLPTGVWRFQNIHYFKWFLPYAGFLIFLWLNDLFVKSPSSNKRFAWLLSLVLGSIILSINIKLKEIDSNKFAVDVLFDGEKNTLRIDSVLGAHLIDKISFANVTGGFESVYFSTDAKVRADGVSLNFVRDFRFLPAPTGSDLVFIRPLLAQTIEIDPSTMAIGSEHTRPRFFVYRYTIGKPKWLSMGYR